VLFFNKKLRCFDLWVLLFDMLKLSDSSQFAFPIIGIVADLGSPSYSVFEDNLKDAV
jgi:hypothetical protein